jgi:hypothetical protein
MGRRWLVSSLAVVMSVLIFPAQIANAGRDWCSRDPILLFADGSRVQWVTQFEATYLGTLTGPVSFRYEVPVNAGPIAVMFPASTTPETVSIAYSAPPWDGKGGMPLRVTITVPASESFRTVSSVRGNVVKGTDIGGRSNAPVKANAKVDATRWYELIGATTIVSTTMVSATGTVTGP